MKSVRTLQAVLVALLMALSLAAAAGTVWAESGVSWEAPVPSVYPVIDPIGISWE